MKSKKFTQDAENYGYALNSAGWEFIDAYKDTMGESAPPALFNQCKGILRRCILKYAEEVENKDKVITIRKGKR